MNDIIPYASEQDLVEPSALEPTQQSLSVRLTSCYEDLQGLLIYPQEGNSGMKRGVLAPALEKQRNATDVIFIQDQTNTLIHNVDVLEHLGTLDLGPLMLRFRALKAELKQFISYLEIFLSSPSPKNAQMLKQMSHNLNADIYNLHLDVYNPQPTLNQKLDTATIATGEAVSNCLGGTAKVLWWTTKGVGKVLHWGGESAWKGGKSLHAANKRRKEMA